MNSQSQQLSLPLTFDEAGKPEQPRRHDLVRNNGYPPATLAPFKQVRPAPEKCANEEIAIQHTLFPEEARRKSEIASTDDDDTVKTPAKSDGDTDALSLYLCEIGRLPLLTREQEVELAKQYEAAQIAIVAALAESPGTIQQVLLLLSQSETGTIPQTDVIRGFFGTEVSTDASGLTPEPEKPLDALDNGCDEEDQDNHPDVEQIKVQTSLLRELHARYIALHTLHGTEHEDTRAAQQRLIEHFKQFKIAPKLLDQLANDLQAFKGDDGTEINQLKDIRRRLEIGKAKAKRAKQAFVEANLRLVIWAAKKYTLYSYRLELLDLIQEGNISLMTAVERFDYRRGFKFSTYAYWWVRQAISRYIANQGGTIRIPVYVHGQKGRLHREHNRYAHELGREPCARELAERMEIPIDDVYHLLGLPVDSISLTDSVGDDVNANLKGLVPESLGPTPLAAALDQNFREVIHETLEHLTSRQEAVIRMRYGFDMRGEYTFEEVAAQFGFIRQRAHQIEVQALRRMRLPKRSDRLLEVK